MLDFASTLPLPASTSASWQRRALARVSTAEQVRSTSAAVRKPLVRVLAAGSTRGVTPVPAGEPYAYPL